VGSTNFYGEFDKGDINPVIPIFHHTPESHYRCWLGVRGYSWSYHPILSSRVDTTRRACVFAFEMTADKEKQASFSDQVFS